MGILIKFLSDKDQLHIGYFFAGAILISGILRHTLTVYAGLPEDSVLISLLFLSLLLHLLIKGFPTPQQKTEDQSKKNNPILLFFIFLLVISPIIGLINSNINRLQISFISEYGLEMLAVAVMLAGLTHTSKKIAKSFLPILSIPLSIIAFIIIGSTIAGKIIEPLGNPNYTGALLAITIPFSLAFLNKNTGTKKKYYIYLFIGITVLIQIFVLKHRAGALSTLIALGAFYAFNNTKSFKKTVLLAFAGLIAAVILLTLIKSDGLESALKSKSFTTRALQYELTYHALADAPFFGYGSGAYTDIAYEYSAIIPGHRSKLDDLGYFSHPHNDWLERAIEAGVFGVAAFIVIFASALLKAGLATLRHQKYASPKNFQICIFSSLSAYFALGLISIANQTPAPMTVSFLIIGLALGIQKSLEQKNTSKLNIKTGLNLLVIMLAGIGTIFSIKNDHETRSILGNIVKDPVKSAEAIKNSSSYFGVTNGLSLIISKYKNEDYAKLAEEKFIEFNSPYLALLQLYAQLTSSKDSNNIQLPTLKYALVNFPEEGITLSSSLLYSAFENDLQGVKISLKKQLGKSLIKNGLASPSDIKFTTFLDYSSGSSYVQFEENNVRMVINNELLKFIINTLASGPITESEGAKLSALIYDQFLIASDSESGIEEKKSVVADIAMFIGLTSTRTPYRVHQPIFASTHTE